MMKTKITGAAFTLTTGMYSDDYTVTFEGDTATVTNIHKEVVFTQHYYHDPTPYAAIDILEAALLIAP